MMVRRLNWLRHAGLSWLRQAGLDRLRHSGLTWLQHSRRVFGSLTESFIKRCPRNGRFRGFRLPTGLAKLLFPVAGLTSLAWFLIRVIPKPSRAVYPCMKVAAPLAAGFAGWAFGLTTVGLAAGRIGRKSRIGRRLLRPVVVLFAALALMGSLTAVKSPIASSGAPTYFAPPMTSSGSLAYLDSPYDPPNQPMGVAKGLYPGRVVWSWNPEATNQNTTNTSGDYWWEAKNNNLAVIEGMLSKSLQALMGTSTDAKAWDLLFRDFNKTHGKGDVGYVKGEKVAVKINLGDEWSRNYDRATGAWRDNGRGVLNKIDSTPYLVLAVMRQLVRKAGVPQENIGIGDPIRDFTGPYYDLCHGEFPNASYWSKSGLKGRTRVTPSARPVIFYSDGADSDRLYREIIDADYLINVPVLKAHARAGISIGAKNHFGSQTREGASHLHRSLPCPNQDGDTSNGAMGQYRVQVDLMGQKDLGGKTVVYIVDGLWGAGEATFPPNKWKSAPFGGDWPNSLILGQDPVAVESVSFDFLFEEYSPAHYDTTGTYYNNWVFPHIPGVEDYLRQAADPAKWPKGVLYDPEKDGSSLSNLGVYEHWNNAKDKQYTRNLRSGNGIELVKIMP